MQVINVWQLEVFKWISTLPAEWTRDNPETEGEFMNLINAPKTSNKSFLIKYKFLSFFEGIQLQIELRFLYRGEYGCWNRYYDFDPVIGKNTGKKETKGSDKMVMSNTKKFQVNLHFCRRSYIDDEIIEVC